MGKAAGLGRRQGDTTSCAILIAAERAGEADDVAKAVMSLMTNDYITGAVLTVDGGLHLT